MKRHINSNGQQAQHNGKRFFVYAFFLLWMVLLLQPAMVSAQSNKQKKEQLQKQMKKLQDEIKTIQAAIKSTSAKREKSIGEILSLQAKIKSRQKLIENISHQIGDLDESIAKTEQDIDAKSVEVEKMKAEYAELLRKSYANITLQNQTAFILSSTSFYQALQRYNYLLTIAEYRRNQAKAIQQSIAELQVKKEDLQQDKNEKENLLASQTSQKQSLENEKKEKDAAVALLQQKTQRLKKQSDEKNKAIKQLNSRIQAIIEAEIQEARRKAEQARKSKTTTADTKTQANEAMPLTPEERALSNSFANNHGKLPWPVTRGHVVSHFGKREHPVLKGVIVENNGVDIKTEVNAEARAVFGGTVVSVFSLPTTHNCVIVKHGEYFTVYSNLETVNVTPNQTITTKQVLGKLHYDKADEITKVHLEIWQGKVRLDPELWLAGN